MDKKYIKNIEHSKVAVMKDLVDYQPGKVVSLTCVQNNAVSMTLFAFDQGEGISAHSAPGDALVYILDGSAQVKIGEAEYVLNTGDTVVMPANVPHALDAVKQFKMLLIVIFQ